VSLVKFLGKRLVAIGVTISLVLGVGYILIYISPGTFYNAANMGEGLSQLRVSDPALYTQYLNALNSRYGLNQPLIVQVAKYVWHTLTFNFGTSFENPSIPIIHQLAQAVPITAILAFASIALAVLVGVPLGVLAAIKRNTWLDSGLTTVSMVGQAVPAYILAVVLVLFFGVWFPGILPINGWGTVPEAVLPVVALCAGNVAIVTRYTRGSMVEVLRQDYVRTAEAKGVSYRRVVVRHALRNSLVALVTVIGPTIAFTFISTLWVEQIFTVPGLGYLMAQAFPNKDVPLAITSVFILALLIMGMNLVVDLLYRVLDPRVKLE
jgi:ABC-type dipeptide/oligopeptide/nickel transport system permease component